MTQNKHRHFAAKHVQGMKTDPDIVRALKEKVKENRVSCAAAHGIAQKCGVSPATVGVNMDLTEMRLNRCQLGLFGYFPEKRIVKPADSVSESLEEQIRARLSNDRLPCIEAWALAKKTGYSRMEIAAACEALGIRVTACQLGAF